MDLQALLETIPALVVCTMPDGSAEFANRACREYTGLPLNELAGNGWQTTIHPDDLAKFIGEFPVGLASGELFESEARIRRADGQYRWFSIRKTQVVWRTPNSEPSLRALFACEDIDERKQQESARRYSEESYRLIVETANDVVISMDGSGAILLANPATIRVFGYHPADLIGKPLTMLMPEFLRKVHEDGVRRYLATGQRHINWRGTELTGLRKSGQEFPVEISFGEMTADGRPIFTGFIRDITERKQAQETQNRLATIVESSQDAILTEDLDGVITAWNKAAERIFGYSAEEAIGQHIGLIFSPHHLDEETDSLARLYRGERIGHFETVRKRKDGILIDVSATISPIKDAQGHIIGASRIARDITERKRMEEALQTTQVELARVSRLTTMGELAASIAHEVNQPLTAVTNNASACLRLLASRNLEPEVLRRVLEEIVSDGTRASAVIARIRAFIKKEPAERKKLDVNTVIQEVLALAGRELSENRVLLKLQLTKALPLVPADRVQLQQVLLNLIMNGIEAMVAVTDRPRVLWVQSQIDESGDVRVGVRDSGTGLSLEGDSVFTPFFTTKANGLGMGLPISRSLVESHGGRMWATPNSPNGTVFSFTVPAVGERPS